MNQYNFRADLLACFEAALVRTRIFDAFTCFLLPPEGAAPCVAITFPPVFGAAPLPAYWPEPEPLAFTRSSASVSSLMYASPGFRTASVPPFLFRMITDLEPVRTALGLGSVFLDKFVLTFIL
jgi:hypothetical protein